VPEHQWQLVASGMITAFKKLFLDAWGIKMERTFRIAILTLLHYPQGALLDMLFQNNAYIVKATDKKLKSKSLNLQHSKPILMKKLLVLTLAYLLMAHIANAQVITGVIKDAKTNQALPFVNVGIVGKTFGTVTNDAGAFTLDLTGHAADIFTISMIGYKSATFTGSDAIKEGVNFSVKLDWDIQTLQEVKINGKRNTMLLGVTANSQTLKANFNNKMLGHEIGIKIKVKKSPALLKRFNASLGDTIKVDSVKLRLNVYDVKNDCPNQNILKRNIFVILRKGDTKINLDLDPYDITVTNEFVITLEWLQPIAGPPVNLSAKLKDGGIWVRSVSADTFTNIPTAAVGYNVLVEY